MEYIDESPLGPEGILNSEQAVLTGKMQVSDVEEMKRFDTAFPMDPRKVLALADKYKDRIETGEVTSEEKFNVIFRELLPDCFDAEKAENWTSVLHFDLDGGGQFTVSVSDGEASIENGLVGVPTCTVQTDAETFSAVIRFEVLEDASAALPSHGDGTRARAVLKMVSESTSEELSDEALEMVAGGKGGKSPGPSPCSGDVCGMDTQPCPNEGPCLGDACGVDSGVPCVGDACAVQSPTPLPPAPCAANVCAVDLSPAPCTGDVCGVDIIPFLPGT